MLGLKLNHVSKRGPKCQLHYIAWNLGLRLVCQCLVASQCQAICTHSEDHGNSGIVSSKFLSIRQISLILQNIGLSHNTIWNNQDAAASPLTWIHLTYLKSADVCSQENECKLCSYSRAHIQNVRQDARTLTTSRLNLYHDNVWTPPVISIPPFWHCTRILVIPWGTGFMG